MKDVRLTFRGVKYSGAEYSIRTVKLTWIEDSSYYFRWFKTQKQAESWAWKNLIDKGVCYANRIQIHCVR